MAVKKIQNIEKIEKQFNTYIKRIAKREMNISLTKRISISQFFSNQMLVVFAIREGIPHSLFLSIEQSTPFTEEDWSHFLNISSKTLQRYKKDEDHVFKSIHSEKIIELAEVTAKGQDVFDSNEKFYNWLNTPSHALGNMKPAELLKDSYGKEMVLNELNRIDQGIFA